MIVAEALLAGVGNQGVSYSRRKGFYSEGRRYREIEYTYTTVLAAVDDLVRGGWLIEQRVQASAAGGWQSSFRATERLTRIASITGGEPSFAQGETIILKDHSRQRIDYPMTRQSQRLHRSLELFNSNLKCLHIDLPGAVRQGHHLRAGNCVILTVPGNGLHRVFNRGSFGCNGRAYAWWQNIPKSIRGGLLINGERTAEADYSALHASILYSERGIKFSGDPYDLDGFPRPVVKMGFNIAVNSDSRYTAVCSIAEKADINRADAAELLAALDHRHKSISDAFCSDDGVRLMRRDSELRAGKKLMP
jgi:hypothetical protein